MIDTNNLPPLDIYLKGKVKRIEVKEGKLRPYLQFTLEYENKEYSHVCIQQGYIKILNLIGLTDNVESKWDFFDEERTKKLTKIIKNKTIIFKLQKVEWSGSFYIKPYDFISLEELEALKELAWLELTL
jgi:CTP:phosphocholine cytidylyltransferase-like protein